MGKVNKECVFIADFIVAQINWCLDLCFLNPAKNGNMLKNEEMFITKLWLLLNSETIFLRWFFWIRYCVYDCTRVDWFQLQSQSSCM